MEAKLYQHYDRLLLHCRYEEEINRRTAAENEFVVLKKVRGARGGMVALPKYMGQKTTWLSHLSSQ